MGMSILSSFEDFLGWENPKIGYVHYACRDLVWLSIWLQHLCVLWYQILMYLFLTRLRSLQTKTFCSVIFSPLPDANPSPSKCLTKCLSQIEKKKKKKRGLGFEAWLIKIVLTLSILQVLLYICGQMFQRNNLKIALGLSKTDENY